MLESEFDIDESEKRTVRLADSIVSDNVVALVYGQDFLDELHGLTQGKRLFDVIVVDCTAVGFYFTTAVLIEIAELAKNALANQGALVLVKSDRAIALVKESVVGQLSFHIFDTLMQIYDYSPSIARHVQSTLGDRTDIGSDGSDLSEQILLAAVPVLTTFGIKLKAGMDSSRRRIAVLSAIDNYTPLSALTQKIAHKVPFEEVLDELRGLEETGVIYPIFAKIPFLVHCFRNKRPFKLKDYLLESRLLTQDQLDNLLLVIQSKNNERLGLGALCVAKGLVSSRQIEIALQDQAFYGQGGETEKVKVLVDQDQSTKVHSLVGHLGTTEPAGLLQSLNSNRESGVLSVENKDLQFRAVFEQGKLVKSKQGKLKGNVAVTEFVAVWKEGIFVFLERQPPADLADDSCSVTRPLDKLLLDSALSQDNIATVWKKLPKGADSTLEKVHDTEHLLMSGQLVDPQENTPLSEQDVHVMQLLWKEFDGLASISAIIKKLGEVTTGQAAAAIDRLAHYGLIKVPSHELSMQLEKFQAIISSVIQRLGIERCNALLRLSLQGSQGYSTKARMFMVGTAAEVGVDLILARGAGLSLTQVVNHLEDWQVCFIEYVSHEMDKSELRDIVYRVHQGLRRDSAGSG